MLESSQGSTGEFEKQQKRQEKAVKDSQRLEKGVILFKRRVGLVKPTQQHAHFLVLSRVVEEADGQIDHRRTSADPPVPVFD